MSNSTSEWKIRLDNIVKMYALGYNHRDRWNFQGLYIELDHESKKMIRDHIMPEGSEYYIPFEDGQHMLLKCYHDSTQLESVRPDGKNVVLVSRESSVKKEYQILEGYTLGLREVDNGVFRYGIGERCPESFSKAFIEECLPGRILSFDSGNKCVSYLCTEITTSTRKLKRLYSGSIKDATIAEFKKAPSVTYRISDDDMQRLYREIQSATGSIQMHKTSLNDIGQEEINKLYHTLEKHRTAVLKIGNECIHVQKRFLSKDLLWFDKNGDRISKDDVKTYIAWVRSSPVQLNINCTSRDIPELDAFIAETNFRGQYEHLIHEKKYIEAVQYLSRISEEHQKEFAISLDSFDGEGLPTTFMFKIGDDGRSHIMMSKADFNGEIQNIKEVSATIMQQFLIDRYANFQMFYQQGRLNDLRRQYPETNEMREKIIECTAQREAETATFDRQTQDALLDQITPALDELANSYLRKPTRNNATKRDDNEIEL